MLSFFKKLFGSAPTETPVPYKVEAPSTASKQAASAMVESVAPAKKPAAKKAVVKAKTPRKPKAPKA